MAGIVESDGFLAPGRTCDFGRLRPLALHRVPPTGPACGLFRGDGFGDEYGGGICWRFDECGGEEGGGGELTRGFPRVYGECAAYPRQ